MKAIETDIVAVRQRLWRERLQYEQERLAFHAKRDGGKLRRLFSAGGALTLALRAVGLHARGLRNAVAFETRKLTFTLPKLPRAFDGFRVLHLTDLHFREGYPAPRELLDLLSSHAVDLCVITGDFRFEHCGGEDHVFTDLKTVMGAIRAEHGAMAALGNHDYSSFIAPFERLGLRTLINANTFIEREGERLWIAGVDDQHAFRCAYLPAALHGIPPDDAVLLLAHVPDIAEEAAAAGVSLCLSGHTHGGQVCLPGGGMLVTNTECSRRYCKGPWRIGDTQGFTSRGVGTTDVPIRFNCPPEIAVIELRCR